MSGGKTKAGGRVLLLKTQSANLPIVIRHKKYGLSFAPRLEPGDLLLFSETRSTLPPGQKPIRYWMTYAKARPDLDGETERLWGKHWRYVILGSEAGKLDCPFDIRILQVSEKNYGQAGPTYLEDDDCQVLVGGGYLKPARD